MNIAAYAVPVGSGGVILGSGGNVYQVVHQSARPAAEAQTVQIISGSQLQAINGQIVTKAIQQQQQEEEQQVAESAEAATVTTSQQQSGLTITPVSAAAATSAPSSAAAAAARPQQTVAVAGVQPGQIIQVGTEDSMDYSMLPWIFDRYNSL